MLLRVRSSIQSLSIAELYGFLYFPILAFSAAYGIFYTLDWPLTQDGTIMHYIAWRILNGAAPYRDLFEADFPGTYLLNMLNISLLGDGDFAFRLFDLFFCLTGAAGILFLGARQPRYYAFAGAFFYIAFHISCGAESMGERDFLMVPFLLFAAFAFRAFLAKPENHGAMFCFGLLAGCTVWIKPIAAIFCIMTAIAILLQSCAWKHKIAGIVYMGCAMAIPAILMHAWLYQIGALASFYSILFNFTLPVYPYIAQFPWGYGIYILTLSVMSFSLLAFLLHKRSNTSAADKTMLTAGLLYGYLHFYLQGKGHWYHIYPLVAFVITYFTIVLPQLRWTWPMTIIYNLVLIFCLLVSPFQGLSQKSRDDYKIRFSMADIEQAENDVNDALQTIADPIRQSYLASYPNQAVQFLSQESFLWDVAYRQKWVTPSRQIMLFPLYDKFHFPYMDARADELFHDLSTIKPLVIVISSKSWPFKGNLVYHLIDTKEPWKTFFANHYRISQERYSYRVYARLK